ncbi:type II toxin-antitoxin system tRNA(fMet)-specific endonuclease VapC [Nitrosophilus alvini]|uniref:type II toxin-antitoxin system tRNA(fMet)-specific endonuclease VapC n=1 Tax=Nitrosophilus alvini TaxID=2714855 RepID=UPI00190CCE73|nr:type II toxin-antitoxin system VapC family toxin [Nitrosophilus alvini]
MKKRMLDTNICIYIIKNRPTTVLKKFKDFNIGDLAISCITVSELYYGAYKSKYTEKNLKALEDFLYPFDIIEFDENAAVEYGKIRASLEKKGLIIGGLDMLIAASAKSQGMVLVTNNTKEFSRIDNLKIENWV